MSVYVDEFYSQHSKASVTVTEDPKTIRVTYKNDSGQRFRVAFVQKPNPIGFHAKFPSQKAPKPK